VQRGICELGLTSVAACGDSLRNITVCPANGFRRGTWDVSEPAEAIRSYAESLPWIRSLPRKFKISLSGCPEACGRPWINDLGLAANPQGTFRAVLAGSLGSKPGTGMLMHEELEVDEVLPLLAAALKLFYAEGDRTKRTRARLRHVRQRMGDEVFRQRIDELFREEKAAAFPRQPRLRRVERETPLQAHLLLPLGDIEPDAAIELGEAVEAAGAELRLGLEHDLFAFGGTPLGLSPALAALTGGPAVVACPGTAWCTRAVADSRGAAARIRGAMPDRCDLSIGVAGCPNNCPQAAVADIGLVGRVKGRGAERAEYFRLLAGGGKGQTPVLARELHPAVPADKLHEAVAWLTQEYRQSSPAGETSFTEFLSGQFDRLAEAFHRRYGAET
jgi:sulfite reductase beta subunit-like hemoprotein